MKLTLKQKYLSGMAVLLILLVILIAAGIKNIESMDRVTKKVLAESVEYSSIQALRLNFQKLLMPPNDFLIQGSSVEIKHFVLLLLQTKRKIADCKKLIGSNKERGAMKKFEKELVDVAIIANRIFQLKDPVGNSDGGILMEDMDSIAENAIAALDETLEMSANEAKEFVRESKEAKVQSKRIIVILGLIIIMVAISASVLLFREIRFKEKEEEALKLSEKKYRTLVDMIPDGLLQVDNNDVILFANNKFCNLIGYSQEELIGNIASKMPWSEKDTSHLIKEKIELRKKGVADAYELPVIKKSGEKFWALLSGSPYYNSKGEVIGSLGIIKDISEQKRLQNELENERKRRLIAINTENVQENERQRIANEMHDGLGQVLTAISYSIDNNLKDSDDSKEYQEQVTQIQDLIDNAIEETKRISHDLSPVLLRDFGLIPAIEHIVDQTNAQKKIAVKFNEYNFSERIDKKIENALYRITQEAVNNILKHSKAKNANIQILRHPESIVLVIDDDGIGFDVDKEIKSKKYQWTGIGLISMSDRAQAHNGTLEINSSPGKGTEILVEIPYQI